MKNLKSILGTLAILAVVAGVAVGNVYTGGDPGKKTFLQDKAIEPGTVFWVNSATGSDAAGYGKYPDVPYATVDYAIGKCTGGAGDIIYVMPGHNEGGSAAIFDADTALISIIGLGKGNDRPRFDFDNTAAKISIGADNVTLKNLTFLPSVSAVVVGIDVEVGAEYFTIEDCEFMVGEASGTDEFVEIIKVRSGASDAVIKHNRFFTAIADTHCTSAVSLGDGATGTTQRVEIVDNWFYGNWSTAAIIDGTTAITECLIENNKIKVKDAEPAIELAAATTCMIVNNRIEATGISSGVVIVGADCSWIENYAGTADGVVGELAGASI